MSKRIRWKGQIYRPEGRYMSLEAIHRVGVGGK